MKIEQAFKRPTKRNPRWRGSRIESPYMVRLVGDLQKHRVYEDWGNIKNKHGDPRKWIIPLVIIVKGVVIPLDDAEIQKHGLREGNK